MTGDYGIGNAGQEPFSVSEARVEVDLTLIDWHSVYAGCADGSVNVTEIGQRSPADADTRGAVCKQGARVELCVHAYCHDVGIPGQPFPPGMQLPKPISDKQKEPLWKDAYGIRMPDDLAALYEQMGEGTGIFHRAVTLCSVIGDGDLPVGLELGLCARAMYQGREAKIDVSPAMALLPDPPSGWAADARENTFPVSYLVKVLKVEPMAAMPPSDRVACALIRRRRANACVAHAMTMPAKTSDQRDGGAVGSQDGEGAQALDEACMLYKCAIEMCSLPSQLLDSTPREVATQARETKIACLLNFAATATRLRRLEEAVEACNAVLAMAPSNRKAATRKDRALRLLKERMNGMSDE